MASNRKDRRLAAARQRAQGGVTPLTPGSPSHAALEEARRARAAGDLDRAVERLEGALARDPDQVHLLLELATALRHRDQPDLAARALRRALKAAPRTPEILANLGVTLRDLGEEEDALRAFARALELRPEFAAVHAEVGRTLHARGDLTRAIQAYRAGLRHQAGDAAARTDLGLALLQSGEAADARREAEAALAANPRLVGALSVLAHAAHELGDGALSSSLFDLERLVTVVDLTEVEGFEDLATFEAALVEHARQHPSLERHPNQRTTRLGRQTGNLNVGERGPVAALEVLLLEAVEAHLARIAELEGHPMAGWRPRRLKLDLWATLLGSGGHQAPHLHPAAWISGVHYAALPAEVREDDPAQEGWLELGAPPDDFPLSVAPVVSRIAPRVGRLVLFPSYLYHRTLPFTSEEERVSLAMDAIPLG
jgi:Tfp pilus assembly protein PilF